MGDSNGSWGELSSHDPEMAEVWDGFARLPDEGVNPHLDAFCERKGITIASLLRLGARLSADNVIAFEFGAGIKYRDMDTGQRWSYTGSEWRTLKIVPAPDGGARTTAIVCEGESDAARLSLLYPSVDVAVMPAGARAFDKYRETYVHQLAGYELVLVGLDNDEAGDAGTAKIMEHVATAMPFRPPANDWCDTAVDDAPPLPAELARPEGMLLQVGGIWFESLDEIKDGPIAPPEVLVEDVLYVEGIHWISGHPGSGKTTFTMHLSIIAMTHEHRHVVWLDYEGGKRPTLRRLQDCGADPEITLERFHYASWPADAEQKIPAIAEQWPGCLVVIDSASKALSFAGKDENSPGEVTAWIVPIVKACKQHGLPIVVIDHVGKNQSGSQYARGASSKLADSDVHWSVIKTDNFNRDTAGIIKLEQQKDREGCLPFESWWAVGDGHGRLTLRSIDAPTDDEQDDDGDVPVS